MRVDLQKFLFVGPDILRTKFFEEAQKFGFIHFIDPKANVKEVSQEIKNTVAAIKVLRGEPTSAQENNVSLELTEEIVSQILELEKERLKLQESLRIAELEKASVAPFGEFSFEDLSFIEKKANRKLQFFTAKEGSFEKKDFPENFILVNKENGLEYFLAINKEKVHLNGFSEQIIKKTAYGWKLEIQKIKNDLHQIEEKLKALAKYNHFLHEALINQYNTYNLNHSEKAVAKSLGEKIFAVSGFVPVDKLTEMKALSADNNIFTQQVEIEPTETIPTYLENQDLGRIGQDLVGIYDTPSSTDKDPSLWVLSFFAIFFAMIVGDAGYGLIFLIIALYMRYKNPNMKGLFKRVWKLTMILSVACILWGITISSFFGISLHSQNPLRKVSLMNYFVEKKAEYHFARKDDVYQEFVKEYPKIAEAKTADQFLHDAKVETKSGVEFPVYSKFTDNILFELALFVGVIHIIFSLLRYVNRNYSAIGWVIFIIGAYLYLPAYLHATSFVNFGFGIPKSFGEQNGIYLMGIGFGLATLLALIQHKIKGVLEPMNLIQIFADTMSYLRIYALSLAGAMVAATINEFAAGTAFVVSVLLFVLGHIINIVLSVMGGVIHGLRLIFIEWYHYSFEGGGKSFNPLRLLQKDQE